MTRIDVVNGIVIGAISRTYALHEPSGTLHGQPRCFETAEEAREWANTARASAIAEVGLAVAKWLKWNQPWELREFN